MIATVTRTYIQLSSETFSLVLRKNEIITFFLLCFFTTAATKSTAGQNLSSSQNTTRTIKLNMNGGKNVQDPATPASIIDDINSLFRRNPKREHPSWKKYFHGYNNKTKVPVEWQQWLDEWKKKEKANESIDFDYYDGRLPLWTGHPTDGVDPPPWAIMPVTDDRNNTLHGRPSYCFLATDAGYCRWNLTRWTFNVHTQKCEKFIFNGCGGNINHFYSKINCEKQCGLPPSTCCGGLKSRT